MKLFFTWARQPTTLLSCAIIVSGIIYWLTRSAAFAAGIAAAILGGVNDHTQDLLARMEAIEDAARPLVATRSVSAVAQVATAGSAAMTAVKPLAILVVAFTLGGS
jgi:hypothetical protein